jgi:hypothetical protein
VNTIHIDPVGTPPSVIKSSVEPEVPQQVAENDPRSPEAKAAFHQFVGEAFYSQMLSAMRKTVRQPAYFHGGRAEEAFQGQLDQVLAEELSKASAGSFSGPMYELFCLSQTK